MPDVPSAIVEPVRGRSRAWILPALALVFVVWLAWGAWGAGGRVIVLFASEGHGVEAGDALRFRGIQVGEVESVVLAEELDGVVLSLRIHPEAEALARAGSRFWIVRPHLSLDSVQGLETIVGARYLAVIPGPVGGELLSEFFVLDEPPVDEPIDPAGLEIVLAAPARMGLAPGAPLRYRSIQVGTVLSIGLASDATAVEMRAYVRPPYVHLVRDNTRFWEVGGFELDLAWTGGLRIELDSLRSLVVGGVALATPTEPGRPVSTGHRFALVAEPEEDWLTWVPALPIGAGELAAGLPAPRPLRAHLSWREGMILRSTEGRSGWLLAVEGGLLGPADLLRADEDAREDTTALELRGERFPLPDGPLAERGGVARLEIEGFDVISVRTWPADRIRAEGAPEDCLVLGDPGGTPRALSAARLEVRGVGWGVDPALTFEESWHGACVVSRADGYLVGVLLVEDGRVRVGPALVTGGD